MSRKPLYLTILFTVFFVLSGIAVSWAKTQCLVMRATNPVNTLWVSKCEDGTCGSFSRISGLFTSQPTLVWDQDTQRYYLYGTGLTGAVWQRTLNMLCQPVSGWQKMTADGVSASPIGAAAGNLYHNFKTAYFSYLKELTEVPIDLLSVKLAVPDDGFVLCRASGVIRHQDINSAEQLLARLDITKTSRFLDYNSMIYSGVAGLTFTASWKAIAFPFAFERIFSETNRIDKTYYLTGDEVGAAADFAKTYVENFFMTCEYYPYSF